ncbi:MAG: hypothetical protein A2Y24_08390, partial [Clostridiales bacterium GWE2_32_10]
MNVQKAGCILLDLNNRKVGLVYRQKQKDFSFPKGHLDSGETLEECAIRETEEETGRKCHIIPSKSVPVLTYTDSRGDKTEAYYFLASDEGPSSKVFAPELVHEIVWKSPEDVEKILSHQNLIDFWNEIKCIINEVLKRH